MTVCVEKNREEGIYYLEPTEFKSVNLIGPYAGSIFRRARAGSIEPALMQSTHTCCRWRLVCWPAWQLSSAALGVTSRQPSQKSSALYAPFEL